MTKARRFCLCGPAMLAAIVLGGCSSGSPAPGSPTATTAPATATPTTAASPTETPTTAAVPTEAQLKSALLTAADLGTPYIAATPTDNGRATAGGCKELAADMNDTSPLPGQVMAEANFTAGSTGPDIDQELIALPTSSFDAAFTESKDALSSCTHLTITSDGITLAFDLTPINFAQGATAARLDGTYQGYTLNGYLAIQRITSNVAMTFMYFQIGSGSSQEAFHIYTLAANKATGALPS